MSPLIVVISGWLLTTSIGILGLAGVVCALDGRHRRRVERARQRRRGYLHVVASASDQETRA